MVASESPEAATILDKKLNLTTLRAEVAKTMVDFQVPGVAIGLYYQAGEYFEGFGVTNCENPLPVQPETLFQAASLTKTFVATLVMQLVEAGKLNLDNPVRKYLPELRLADEGVASKVTLRHLLSHTGGWVGDFYEDTGWGDDALARYIEKLSGLLQVTPLGEVWSYCNSGYALLGRVIESVTGLTFEAALEHYLLGPLNMEKSCLFPHEAMTYSFAVGHATTPAGSEVQRPWYLPRCISPAGGLISNAKEMLHFARLHLNLGKTLTGTRLLSENSVKAMWNEQIEAGGLLERMALGWWSRWTNNTQILSHGGMGMGQVSVLEIIPEFDLALIIFTNSYGGLYLTQHIKDFLYRQLLGFSAPVPTPVAYSQEALAEYTGRYCYPGDKVELVSRNGELEFLPLNGGNSAQGQPQIISFIRERPDKAVFVSHPFFKGVAVEFLRNQEGAIKYLRFMSKVYIIQKD